ncbi:hypothetical protein ES705_25229 [subsurface metagenome]
MLDVFSITETIACGFLLASREGWSFVHVCHFDGELCVLPSGHSFYRHKVFYFYDLERIKAGFSSEEWLDLLKPIISFYFEDHKCPPSQKPFQSMNVT